MNERPHSLGYYVFKMTWRLVMNKLKNLSHEIDGSIPDVFLDIGFKTILEQHLEVIKKDINNTYVEVSAHDCDLYQGNFDGLLYKNRIPIYLHWLVTRMNGFDSHTDFNGDIDRIILPDPERINKLKEIYLTIHKI